MNNYALILAAGLTIFAAAPVPAEAVTPAAATPTAAAKTTAATAQTTTAAKTTAAATRTLLSPDGTVEAEVKITDGLAWSVKVDGKTVIADSRIAMTLENGLAFGPNDKLLSAKTTSKRGTLKPVVYKKNTVNNDYNELTLSFREFNLIFRAFNDGVAYRFTSKLKGSHKVISETSEFSFADDCTAYVPYVKKHAGTFESQFKNSFENTYVKQNLSEWDPVRLAFLPLAAETSSGIRVCITEADLLDYPGMYLNNDNGGTTLKGVFAPYPKLIEQGGHNMLQGLVKEREPYLAKISGPVAFPWRAVALSRDDIGLADSDLVWKLATPCRNPEYYSWVKPGKVAWEWWNDWSIYGVDFKAGINNDTYKYYIDFASKNNIEYVILDEGWAVNRKADLFDVIPEIDLPMLCEYAASKNVGLILWAGYWAFNRDMEKVCSHYSAMGVKGFKVDFMDRDDQPMVNFFTRAAEMTSRYKMMIDFHGAFKPTGLQRTYPNVINYEGVAGLENLKWHSPDPVAYDVTIPFVRMLAGPMDYTQGAMRNASRGDYRPVYSEPMSQGTRCHQLAEYVIFESPLNMLCDSPTNYLNEPECTGFIAGCPTTWDETLAIDGAIGEYVIMARRKGDVWYLGALTNWTSRDLTVDLSFLGEGVWTCESFADGPNADKVARDYTRTEASPAGKSISFHLAEGGGYAAVFRRN